MTSRTDYNWFVKTDLSRYQGKYIAIAGKKVISSGYNAKGVYNQAIKKLPKIRPTLAKIPSEDTRVLVAKVK